MIHFLNCKVSLIDLLELVSVEVNYYEYKQTFTRSIKFYFTDKNSSDTLEDVMPLFYINLSVYDKEHIKYKFNDAIESLMDALSTLDGIKRELKRLMNE